MGSIPLALFYARAIIYMMKLDLKNAYYAVPIHPVSRKHLRLQFKGTTNEFRCLPFGPRPLPDSQSLHQNPPFDCRQTAFRRDTKSHLLGRSSPDHHQLDTLSEIVLYVRIVLSSLCFIVTFLRNQLVA